MSAPVEPEQPAPYGSGPAPAGGDPSARPVLSAADVARMVDRMAHQLIERAATDADPGDPTAGLAGLVLVGIPTRGAPLARRLADRIEAFAQRSVDVGTVDITLYRDDLRLRGVRALEPTVLPDAGIDAFLRQDMDDQTSLADTWRLLAELVA